MRIRLAFGRAILVSAAILTVQPAPALAQSRPSWPLPGMEVLPLWPEGVPGQLPNAGPEEQLEGARVSNVHTPTLTVALAPEATRNGTAVIICPGGAYRRLAIDKEGTAVAAWLNSLGVSAFILKYRMKEYGHPAPLQDVLRAVRLLRSEAPRWGSRPTGSASSGFLPAATSRRRRAHCSIRRKDGPGPHSTG